MLLTVKRFAELTAQEVYKILQARFEVFVMEQHCFYLDPDDIDYEALHLCLWDGEHLVAYARLFPDRLAPAFVPLSADPNAWHCGRLLTRERRQGLGKKMVEALIQTAQQHCATILRMEAQCYIMPLYEQYGFVAVSEPFDDAGVQHVEMEKRLI
ncbi:MAG: GNAT family N-acetyltransferase [Paludibacteraceae bacterium]|nr:GNAT family N-acetyltransferase [Paludibacteraceae bacterium]